ncbi:hypothetical protein RCO48_25055 [Peribacillus frigoritolerans]|nr:hypothetical protein [Peribacillus frigoritolerans]
MVQNALSFSDPFTFNAVRFFMAFVFLLIPYLLTLHKKGKNGSKGLFKAGFHIGVWLFSRLWASNDRIELYNACKDWLYNRIKCCHGTGFFPCCY